jgi:hypothetical protein
LKIPTYTEIEREGNTELRKMSAHIAHRTLICMCSTRSAHTRHARKRLLTHTRLVCFLPKEKLTHRRVYPPPTRKPTPRTKTGRKRKQIKEKSGARTARSLAGLRRNGQAAGAGTGDVGASAAQAEEEGPPLAPRPPKAQPPPRDAAGGCVRARAAPPLHPPQPGLRRRRLRRAGTRPPREEAPPRHGARRRIGQGGRLLLPFPSLAPRPRSASNPRQLGRIRAEFA